MCMAFFNRYVCESCGHLIRIRSREVECWDHKKNCIWETLRVETKVKAEDCPKCIRRKKKKKENN